MPKVKRTPDRYDSMRLLLQGKRAVLGFTYRDIAERLDCSPETVRTRLSSPGNLTVNELRQYSRILDIPADDLRQAIPF